MNTVPNNTTPSDAVQYGLPQEKQGRGCFFYGCLTSIVLSILLVLAVYFAIRSVVHSFTSDKPIALAVVSATPEQQADIRARAERFIAAFKAGESGVSFKISGDEFNQLLMSLPQLEKFKDVARVSFVGDRAVAVLSAPLTAFGFSDRYVTGEASLKIGLQRGELVVHVLDFKTPLGETPPEALRELSSQNMAEQLMDNPDARIFIAKLATLEIKDGVLLLVTK
jgi:hypothetical protein